MKKQIRQPKQFPYVLARIAGGPMPEFNAINVNKSNTLFITLNQLDIAIDTHKENISNLLHHFIASITEKKLRYTLIKFRRDIYNEKYITSNPVEFKCVFSKSLKKQVSQYLLLVKEKQSLLSHAEKIYTEEFKNSKKKFKNLLKKANFQNGLLLSSDTLMDSYKKYLTVDDKLFPKVERSLISYLSRMYTKPSPFSTFTALALGTFSNVTVSDNKRRNVRRNSHIELNHYLFFYLYNLLIQNKDIRKHFNLRLNSTVRFSHNQYIYLANNFNNESVQHINSTPIISYIYTLMLNQKKVVYADLIKKLISNQFSSVNQIEMEKYIDQLLLYGFIEYDLGISIFDNEWDKKLIPLLQPIGIKYSLLKKVGKTLQELRKAKSHYEKATHQKREFILQQAFKKFRATCLQLYIAASLPVKGRGSFKNKYIYEQIKDKNYKKNNNLLEYEYPSIFKLLPHSLWYEDTTYNSTFTLSTNVKSKLNLLGKLLSHMGVFDTCTEELYKQADFFKSNYPLKDNVDLLKFFEDYSLKPNSKPALPTKIKEIRRINKKYFKMFIKNINVNTNKDDIINFTLKDVEFIPQITSFSSFAVFFQIIKKKSGETQIVINNTMNGFGKFYSRFLKLFSYELTKSIREYNKKNKGNILFAEIADASIFNANSHPYLVPFEISLVKSNRILSTNKQILLNEIAVAYDNKDDRVHLLHKNNKKEIYIFDLGFQGVNKRSEIYGFLSNFSSGPHHHVHHLIDLINFEMKKNKKNEQIVVLPRISFENNIILQRKTWEIFKGALPTKLSQETEWNYFRKIKTWKYLLKIPDEIFITIKAEKPLYINFNNPYLIQVFENTIKNMNENDILRIQEMTPNSDEINPYNGKQYVTEFVTQWYLN